MSAFLKSRWRSDFPMLSTSMHGKPLAFLDSGASAQKPQIVIDTMVSVMQEGYSNIHRGLYDISQKLTARFEEVRAKIAQFINAPDPQNIVFTRNATEGINLVAQSWGRTFLNAGDEIILSAMEHHANIVPWQILAEQKGVVLRVLPITSNYQLDLDAFQNLLSPKTRMICLVEISNVLGTINPIADLILKTRAYNSDIKILVDGSQAVVHKQVNVVTQDADFYVFTGHKLYGPTGVGILYAKYDLLQKMPPYQGGGDMIEKVSFSGTRFREAPYRFEAGTPAIIEIIGLGAAVDYISNIGIQELIDHEHKLLAYAHSEIAKFSGIKLYGPADISKKAGIISFSFHDVHASDVGMVLDQCGVAVRTGHHCCMPLMEALGVDSTVRASFGLYTDQSDVDALLSGLHKVNALFG